MFAGKLAVSLGFTCDFKCEHCANGFEKPCSLTPAEKKSIVSVINKYKIRKLHFIGGEPTLYLRDINEIVRGINDKKNSSVVITTNGGFAKSVEKATSILKKIPLLKKVQLSYDKFHAKFMPLSGVANVHSAAINLGLEFGVLFSIQNPLDMALISELRKIGDFPIMMQKVLPQGSAATNNAAYNNHMVFDKKVLKEKCPERNDMVYICGKGFTFCCSALVFNLKLHDAIFKNPEEMFKSALLRQLKDNNFGALMKKHRVSSDTLMPLHSSVCNLCEHIFSTSSMARWR